MTWRIYRWDDASAPTLSGADGSLPALLKSVLVGTAGTAYGSVPAAGWTCPYDTTNIKAFTNGGAGQGIKVTHAGSQYPQIAGYESITGGGVITNQFPTDAQISGGVFMQVSNSYNSTAKPWIIAADASRFYLWVAASLTTAQALSASAVGQPMLYSGDLFSDKGGDAYPFALIGATSASNTSNYFGGASTATSGTLNGHYIARAHTQSVGSVQGSKQANLGAAVTVMGYQGISYPDPVSGGMRLSPVNFTENGNIRGRMPGLWAPMHALPGANGDTFSGVGALAGKTFILLDVSSSSLQGRIALETSNTLS